MFLFAMNKDFFGGNWVILCARRRMDCQMQRMSGCILTKNKNGRVLAVRNGPQRSRTIHDLCRQDQQAIPMRETSDVKIMPFYIALAPLLWCGWIFCSLPPGWCCCHHRVSEPNGCCPPPSLEYCPPRIPHIRQSSFLVRKYAKSIFLNVSSSNRNSFFAFKIAM